MKSFLIPAILGLLAIASTTQAGDTPKPYPLQTCFVTGEKLGEMGKPVVLIHDGQEYKFCCNSCKKKFEADPGKYTKEFQTALKAKS